MHRPKTQHLYPTPGRTEVLLTGELLQTILQRGGGRLVHLERSQVQRDVPERVDRRRHVTGEQWQRIVSL